MTNYVALIGDEEDPYRTEWLVAFTSDSDMNQAMEEAIIHLREWLDDPYNPRNRRLGVNWMLRWSGELKEPKIILVGKSL